MMKLILNDKNEILNYVMIGSVDGGIEYDGEIPENFEIQFKANYFLLKDNVIVVNSNYISPNPIKPNDKPSDVQKAIAQLTLQAAQQKVIQDKLNAQVLLEIAQLKGGNN